MPDTTTNGSSPSMQRLQTCNICILNRCMHAHSNTSTARVVSHIPDPPLPHSDLLILPRGSMSVCFYCFLPPEVSPMDMSGSVNQMMSRSAKILRTKQQDREGEWHFRKSQYACVAAAQDIFIRQDKILQNSMYEGK